MKEIKLDKKEREFLIELLSHDKSKKAETLLKRLKKAEKKIKPSSAKSKGRGLQYFVCEEISELLDIPYSQSDDNCLIHSREMGLNGVDVILRGEAREMFPFSIECKACETLAIPQWVEQARANTAEGTDWLLIFRKQSLGATPFITMDWKTFKNIYKNYLHKK